MLKTELYWLAGIIEAEGGFYAGSGGKRGGVKFALQFYNTNLQLHARVVKLTGGTTYAVKHGERNRISRKPSFMTVLNSDCAVRLAETLMPIFTDQKREQTQAAITKWKSRRTTRGRPYPPKDQISSCDKGVDRQIV